MQTAPDSRALELVTAVLLGLISLITALLAWQGQAWTMTSDAFERDAENARDVSVTQSVLAEYSRSTDAEASATARLVFEDYVAETDPAVQLTLANEVAAALSRATPGFDEYWYDWAGQAFPDEGAALENEDYLVYRDGTAQSYGYVARLAATFDDRYEERAQILSQAALVNALALFLVGISGVNRSRSVRVAVLGIGTAVFLGALLIAAGAF